MPTPEVRLALANLGAIARSRLLLVGFGSAELTARAAVTLEHDLVSARASGGTFAPWLLDGAFDSVLIHLPKATERTRMLLAMTAAVCAPGASVALIGRNDAGIKSAGRFLAEFIGPPSTLDFRLHCRALVASLGEQAAPFDPSAWRLTSDGLVSYPGVFAHGRLDPATSLLLDNLLARPGARALDVGCGSGAIAAWLARHPQQKGAHVVATDTDALALEATRETCAGLNVEVRASDVYSDVSETGFDLIASNPPFHAGIRTTHDVAHRLIAEAPAHLARAGELWVVANRFLDYAQVFEDAFGSVTKVAEDSRYRVWRARRA